MVILKTLFLVGTIQGVLLTVILLSFRKFRTKANYFLAMSVFIQALILVVDYLFHGNEPLPQLKHSDFHVILAFVFAPLFYLYIRSRTGRSLPGAPIVFLYFLPFIATLCYIFAYIFLDFKHVLYELFIIIEIGCLLDVLAFIVVSILDINKYQKKIKDTYSNLDKINLQWLKIMAYTMALIILSAGVLYFWKAYFDIVWVFVAFLVYLISIYTLKEPALFATEPASSFQNDDTEVKKYQKSSLNSAALDEKKSHIERIIKEEKLYLDNEITLPILAEKLSISVHHLSQIINQAYNKNFYDFINYYRIEHAKEMLTSLSEDDSTILNISYHVGFNTISSFNKSFKKLTGLTPTQFKDRKRHS